jgi:prolyl-tRNA synthetase
MVLVRRDTLEKKPIKGESLLAELEAMLSAIDENLAVRAQGWMKERESLVDSLEGVKKRLDSAGGIVEAPWCGGRECGEGLEQKVDARILGVPYAVGASVAGAKCIGCGREATKSIRVARAY